MAWYHDLHKLRHTETYSNAETAANDAHQAAAEGWQVEAPADLQRFPPWFPGGALGTFNAGNRQPGEVEVTYIRTPEWLEQHAKR